MSKKLLAFTVYVHIIQCKYKQCFFIKIYSHFFQKVMLICLHIFPTPLYTIAMFRPTSLCTLQKVGCCPSSHLCTKSLTSSSALNLFHLRAPLSRSNRWKFFDARSGLLAGCGSISQCISSSVLLWQWRCVDARCRGEDRHFSLMDLVVFNERLDLMGL